MLIACDGYRQMKSTFTNASTDFRDTHKKFLSRMLPTVARRVLSTNARSATMSNNGTSPSISSLLTSLDLSFDQKNHGVFDGQKWRQGTGTTFQSVSPIDNRVIAEVTFGTEKDYEECAKAAHEARLNWAKTPAPIRGEAVRRIGEAVRLKKNELASLITLEMGKITSEALGEVQELIDVCDMACGMSRQLPGQILPSERSDHVLMETYHPLGMIGIIPAFNFPIAVYGWNSCISLVCGNTQIVKPAETASLSSIALQKIVTATLESCGHDPRIAVMVCGKGNEIGNAMTKDERVRLVSFTGSTKTGREVQRIVGDRFGKTLLELGGNNAVVVMNDADLDMAARSVLFSAVGTCGQRCTSLRRLLVQDSIYENFKERLVKMYSTLRIGDPRDANILVGPLHTKNSMKIFETALETVQSQGGKLLIGGKKVENLSGNYVYPALVEIDSTKPRPEIVSEERFVPILYLEKFQTLENAIDINNSVRQGLSSAIFTRDMRNVFQWLGTNGSDTGIANVNTGCSGAEIGGAFGGNKETGWGRESGSDAWKMYMRRGTHAINYGSELPLAQGVVFE